jgi:hypothetical protein
MTKKSFNDLLQYNSINISQFIKVIKNTKIVFNYGSCFNYMFKLSEDLLNDRI